MPPSKKIASNWLLTAEGWVENPLLVETSEGWRMAGSRPTPDREPFTRFEAGVVVQVQCTPAELQNLMQDHTTPIDRLLAPYLNPEGRWLHIAGLDYTTRCFTPQSRADYL